MYFAPGDLRHLALRHQFEILFIIITLIVSTKKSMAGKHNFSVADRCSTGFICVCICNWEARDVRPDTICFGCISMYFATPNTDRMTTAINVRNANVLILVRIISPLNVLNVFLNVHRIISEMAFGFKRILAGFGLKGRFRVVGWKMSGFIGQRRKVFLRFIINIWVSGFGLKICRQ